MKNRRTVLVAFLLVATMVMGIGYAAYSGLLNINGEATFYNPDKETVDGMVKIEAVDYDEDVTATQNGNQAVDITAVFDLADAVEEEGVKYITKTVSFKVTYNPAAAGDDVIVPNVIIRGDKSANYTAEIKNDNSDKLSLKTDLEDVLILHTATGDALTTTFTLTIKLDTTDLATKATETFEFTVPVEYEFTQATSLS